MLISLILMLIIFVGVYLYMSKKLDQTNIADQQRVKRQQSPNITATKLELEKNRIKLELFQFFPSLNNDEQLQWIAELKELSKNQGQENGVAS
jgi:hypothetical protein